MNSSQINQNLLNELERADSTLSKILEQLRSFNDSLKPVELALRVNDFASKGVLRRGTIKGVVCILTALIRGDPFFKSLDALEGKGLELPSIIKSADRIESKDTCDSILKIVESLSQRNLVKFVVNLRWCQFPISLNNDKTIIIGTRYNNMDKSDTKKIASALTQRGYEVFEDRGEYGGGLLTYSLLDTLDNAERMKVFEVTLSKQLAESEFHVANILEVLSSL